MPLWVPWKTAYEERFSAAAPGALCLSLLTDALLRDAQANTHPFRLDSLADSQSVIANRLWRDRWHFVDVMIDLTPGGSGAFRAMLIAEMTRRSAYEKARHARRRLGRSFTSTAAG